MNEVEKTVAELKRYVRQKILEFKMARPKEYRIALKNSKPDLRIVFGDDCIADSVESAIENIKTEADVKSYFTEFDYMASDYGANWYDEDTECVRSGYKYESCLCMEIRNILAKAIGEKTLPISAYYDKANYKEER